MISKKIASRMFSNIVDSFQPKKSHVMSYVLGGIGLSLIGGIAAIMVFSPRTRYRALDVAKETYGKMSAKVGHQPNGLVEHASYDTTAASGL